MLVLLRLGLVILTFLGLVLLRLWVSFLTFWGLVLLRLRVRDSYVFGVSIFTFGG